MFRILFCFLGCLSLWVQSESFQYKFSDMEKIEVSADQLEILLDESNLTTILDLDTKPVKNRYPRVEPVVLYASQLQLNFQLT